MVWGFREGSCVLTKSKSKSMFSNANPPVPNIMFSDTYIKLLSKTAAEIVFACSCWSQTGQDLLDSLGTERAARQYSLLLRAGGAQRLVYLETLTGRIGKVITSWAERSPCSVNSLFFHAPTQCWISAQIARVQIPACPRRRALNTAASRLRHWQLPQIRWCRKNDSGSVHPRLLFLFDPL